MTRLNDGDDLEIAEEEDFGVARGNNGELLPVKQRIPGTDRAIKCIPVTPGVRQEYTDVFDSEDAEAERVAELWSDRIIEGVGNNATADDIEEMPHGLIAGINQALKNSSGEQIFLAVREQVNEEIAGHMEMVQQMDDESIKTLLDSASSSTEQ